AREGRPLSRESLAEALRAQGLAMSNARAGELVRLVRQRVDGAADEPSGHPDGVLSAGAGHRADA
ncbi:MAG: hypothetical protein HKP61_19480, partial [Dactylosporangium sp.]|nr:hypothetical protein [Dactylosporangium sp.]NNJ63072.1 hypothetical protein [Dactylosporangium sp.]